jgi:ferredoxin-like protein FixX
LPLKNPNTEIKWQATLIDWSIVLYPDIYKATETPLTVFAKLNCGRPVALFGREMNDPRYNAEKGDAFADGHRLVTSPIIAVKNEEYHTADTIYTLDEAAKNTDFKEWCEKNQYKEVPLDGVWEKNEEQGSVVLRHICENCGKEQILSSEEGYTQGWDYPPKMVFLKSYRRGLVASRYRNHTLVGNSVQQDSFRPVR